MWVISKYNVVLVLILVFVLVSCSKSTSNTKFNTHVTRIPKSSVPVIRDDTLGNYSDERASEDKQDSIVDINSRVPVYIITGRYNSLSSVYGQILCNNFNNDFSNSKYLCIIQSQKDINEAGPLLRKDDLSVDKNIPYVADFLVTRIDYLLQKQQYNSGPLKDFPTLDVVMFLNGSYLYLWGNSRLNSTEFSNFVKNFSIKYPKKNIKVAVANSLAKELITKVILSNTWAANFEFLTLNEENSNSKFFSTQSYNIVAYAGPVINNKLVSYIKQYNNSFIPLSLSDEIILNVQKAYPEVSGVNITKYFTPEHLTKFVKVSSSLNSTNDYITSGISSKYTNSINVQDEQRSLKQTNLPFIRNKKCASDYDKYIFGKSKFNFNVRPIEDILSVDEVVNISNIKINSIGIRNVLVATRSTDPVLVFYLLSAALTKHDLIKVNFVTPDMQSFNIHNLITGNLYNNNFIYHYGVLNFTNFATNYNSNRLWDKEAEISGVISKFLDDKNAPPFYGPNIPNSAQINTINRQVHQRIIRNKQEKVLENFKSIIDTIKEEMKGADKKSAQTVHNKVNHNSSVQQDGSYDHTTKNQEPVLNVTPLNNSDS